VNIYKPELDIETIKKHIDNLGQQQNSAKSNTSSSPYIKRQVANKEPLHINDFLKFEGTEFIEFIYATILRRLPDLHGLRHKLHLLQTGKQTQLEILVRIRLSPEGRKNNVSIKGFSKAFLCALFFGIPGIGAILRYIKIAAQLPVIAYKVERNAILQTQHQVYAQQAIQTLQATAQELTKNIEILSLESNISKRALEASQKQAIHQQRHILDLQYHLNVCLAALQQKSQIVGHEIEMKTQKPLMTDSFYLALEERFRGSKEQIKQRVSMYLPLIIDAKAGVDTAPILDVGCGRGEFLEVLKENQLIARGLDTNKLMIQTCRELDLDVLEVDALQYLQNLSANSIGAITAIHIIEHLPFTTLMTLFDEAYRVLVPNGILIFETPNPENVFMGACNFHMDPSHIKPLPPLTLEFIAGNRGFERVQIMRLRDERLEDPLKFLPRDIPENENINYMIDAVKTHLFAAVDYAIIGYKPNSLE